MLPETHDLAILIKNNYFLIQGLNVTEARQTINLAQQGKVSNEELIKQLQSRFKEKFTSIPVLPPGSQAIPNLSTKVTILSPES